MNTFFQLITIITILFLIAGIVIIMFINLYFKKCKKLTKSDIVPKGEDAFRVMQEQVKEFIDKKKTKDVKDLSIKELYSELRELRGRVVELNEECLKREREVERNYNNNSPYNGNRTI
jgi:site-specific DNA-adenine methylase